MQDVVIFGTGGFAREVEQLVLDLIEASAPYRLIGFLDGNQGNHGILVHGLPVLGDESWLKANPSVGVVVAVGNTATRRAIVKRIEGFGHTEFPTFVHPRAWVGRHVQIGSGTVICAGNSITTDVQIGDHVILNLNCTVGHDAVLEDFVTVAPSVNVSGNVALGEGCDVGTGAAIIQGVEIGAWSIVGAGSVVVRPLPPNVTAVGVPARVLKERPVGWHESK